MLVYSSNCVETLRSDENPAKDQAGGGISRFERPMDRDHSMEGGKRLRNGILSVPRAKLCCQDLFRGGFSG